MKQYFRYSFTLMLIIAATLVAQSAFASWDAYLKLVSKTGESYTAKLDANGKFSFGEVPPGTYELRLMGSAEYFNSKDGSKVSVDSWSWGASNSGSAGSGARSGREASTGMSTGRRTPVADVDADGLCAAALSKEVTVTKPRTDGDLKYIVIAKALTCSLACTPSGAASRMAINVKGPRGDGK